MDLAHRQLKLLLWKNFLLRIRQPVILALELLWPIIIFLTIMGARWTILPQNAPTCRYNAWALPTAGGVPFLQSLICNIDNDCLNESEYHEVPSYPNSKIESLVSHMIPLLSDQKLRNFVQALPTGAKLARSVLDMLSKHDLQEILENGIPVSSLLKNSNDTRMLLNQYFPENITDDLFDSYIRLPQLFQFMSSSTDLKICGSQNSFFNELIRPTVWPKIQKNFCELNESDQQRLLRDIQVHLDVAGIVHMVGNVMSQLGRVDVGEMISRIGFIIQSLSSKFIYPSLFSGNIYPLLDDLWDVIEDFQEGNVDLNLISLVADDTLPLYENSNWSMLKTIVDEIKHSTKKHSAFASDSVNSTDVKVDNADFSNLLSWDTGQESSFLRKKQLNDVRTFATPNSKNTERKNISFNLLKTFGDWVEIGLHILRLLPEEHIARITGHKLFAMFRFAVSTLYELTKSATSQDIRDFFDLAESVLYTMSNEGKSPLAFDPAFWKTTLCNKTEFLMHLSIPDRIDPLSLQEFACNVTTTAEEVLRWWPSSNNIQLKSADTERSELFKMIEFLVSHSPEDTHRGSKSTTFRTKLLRLQVAFSDFTKHLSQKSNLTSSLTGLLRVMHSAFPSASAGSKVIPLFVKFIRTFTKDLSKCIMGTYGGCLETEGTSFVYVDLIRSLMLSIVDGIESVLWESLGHDTLKILQNGNLEFCKIKNNSFVCSENSTLTELYIPPETLLRKHIQNKIPNWDQFKKDLDYLQGTLMKLHSSNFKNSTYGGIIPPILSAISAGMASSHLLLPTSDCSVIPVTAESIDTMFCYILRIQNMRRSLKIADSHLNLAIRSISDKHAAFLWNALAMLVRQTFHLASMSDLVQFPDAEEEILETLNALAVSSFPNENGTVQFDLENHIRLALATTKLIGSTLETDIVQLRSLFHTLQSVVNLLVNRIRALASTSFNSTDEKTIVRVEEVFPGATVTQKVVKSLLPRLPEVLSTLFWTSLAQGKLHHLATESRRNLTIVTKLLCNETVTDYLYNPSFAEPHQWDSLMNDVCAHPYFKVFEELLEDPDIQGVIFEADNIEDPIDWDEFQSSVIELTSLVVKLDKERKLDSSVLPTSAVVWNELWRNISKTMQRPSVSVYVLTNSLFYRFCDRTAIETGKFKLFGVSMRLSKPFSSSNVTQLAEIFCSMSRESFSDNLVQKIQELLQHSNFHFHKEHYMTLLSATNIRAVIEALLGSHGYGMFQSLEDHFLNKWNFSDTTLFYSGGLAAAEKLYALIDYISDGNLSLKFSSTQLPFILESINSYAESGGPLRISNIVSNVSTAENFCSIFFNASNEKKIFYHWLSIKVNYFSNETNRIFLKDVCSTKTEADNSTFIDEISFLCQNEPSKWVDYAIRKYGDDTVAIYRNMSNLFEFLAAEKNFSQKMFRHEKKILNAWTRNVLQSTFRHLSKIKFNSSDWLILRQPSAYINFSKGCLLTTQNFFRRKLNNDMQECNPSKWSLRWSNSPPKLLNAIPDAEYLLCNLTSKNISSVYQEFSNIIEVKQLFSEYFKSTSKLWAPNCSDVQIPWTDISLKWILSSLNLSERIFRKFSIDLSHKDKVFSCIKDFTRSSLFLDTLRFGTFVKNVFKLITDLMSSGVIHRNWKDVENDAINLIVPQLPGFSRLSSFSNLTFPINESSEYILKIIKQSAFNLNLLSQKNFSISSLKTTFCQTNENQTMNGVILIPPKQGALKDIIHFLCNDSGFEILFSRINLTLVNQTLRLAQEQEFYSGQWMSNLIAATSGVLEDIVRLVRAIRHIAPKSSARVPELFLESLLRISKTGVLKDLLTGLNGIVMKMKQAWNGSPLLDQLQQILNGFQAFQSLQGFNLFNFKVKIQDLFRSGDIHKELIWLLQDKYKLNNETIDVFMNIDFDLNQVLDTLSASEKNIFCLNESSTAYSFKEIELFNLINVTTILCEIMMEEKFRVPNNQLKDLVLGKIFKNIGELGLQGVLSEAHIDFKQAEQTMHILSEATQIIPELELELESLLSILDSEVGNKLASLNISQRGVAALGSPEALATGGEILCGKPLKTLQRKFSLLTLVENKEPVIDQIEVENLPNEFCQNGYQQVMKMPGGAILWGFLKPLFRGKILYAPKDLIVTQAVISEVNKTLGQAYEYIQLLQAIAEGSTGLNYLERKGEILDSVEQLLNSKSVAKLLGVDVAQISGFLSARDLAKNFGSNHASGAAILELVTLVGNISQCIILNRFVGFDTETDLEKAAAKLHMAREFIAGIVFLDDSKDHSSHSQLKINNPVLPFHIHYKIRMDIDNVPTAKEIRHRWWRPYPYDNFFDDFRYFRGFVQLQELFDSAILKLHSSFSNTSSVVPFKKYFQQFPYPCHQQDKFGTVLKGSLPGVMTISWIFFIAFLVRDKVLEKELALQEILSVMGLHPALAWIAWFLTGLVTIMISVTGIVIIMKWGGITPLSNTVILFLFVFDFAILLIAYCHLMSSLFQRAAAASLVAIVTYVLSFFPFLLFITWELYFQFWHKILACTLVATSFCFGCLYLNRLEDQGQGIQWNNLWSSPIPDDSMSMGLAMVTMAICSVLYFAVAIYISKVKTVTNSGRKLPWYLLPLPLVWRRKSSASIPLCQNESGSFTDISDGRSKSANLFAKESVIVRNLKVVYSSGLKVECKEAISNVSLSLFENQITTLLGHNGAGKTTTIKVLTGRISPDAGSVSIYTLPIPQFSSEACKLIGYCPQYNTLYDRLTVREQLLVFARLKRLLSGPELDQDIDRMLESLGLTEKQNVWTEQLSGGQRRRLCVGMAFVGGSKFIILDEPTSSVDPLARRSIWDVILRHKKGRTILLTTHHLDEADILSDQVCVLHKGKLLCNGSPLILKSQLGSGYKLKLYGSTARSSSISVDSQPHDEVDSGNVSAFGSEEGESNFKHDEKLNIMNGIEIKQITEFIHRFVPSATIMEKENGVTVGLPQLTLCSHSIKPDSLSSLFRELDLHLSDLGFKSYSISSTSLEEVFLTLCNLEDSKCHNSNSPNIKSLPSIDAHNKSVKPHLSNGHKNDLSCEKTSKESIAMKEYQKPNSLSLINEISFPMSSTSGITFNTDSVNLHKGYYLKCSQFRCLLKKRLWHTYRNWRMVLCGIFMPCLFIALAMGLAVGRPARRPEPRLELSPQLYATKAGRSVSFFSLEGWSVQKDVSILKSLLSTSTSYENPCFDSGVGKDTCKKEFVANDSGHEQPCLCKIDDHCPVVDIDTIPFVLRSDNEILYNLTGYNVPKHLLDTYIKFNEQRYGGWTFINSKRKKRPKYPFHEDERENNTIAKIWFDNSGYHAAPSFLNTFNNAILNAMMKSGSRFNTDKQYGITTYSHPMQLSAEQLGQETLLQRLGEIGIAFVFLIGLSLIPSSSALYLVKECSLEEKRVQMASGVGPWLYWGTHLIWDLGSLLVTTILASTVIYLFALPPFVHRLNFLAVISLLLCFGWASIPLMYICSRFFKEGSLAFMVLFTTNLFIGLIVLLVVISLHMLNISSDAEQALFIVKRAALIFPQWSLLGGLTALAQNQLQSDIFNLFGQDTYANPFSWTLLLPNYLALLLEGSVFYLLNIAFEINIFTTFSWRGWSSTNRKVPANAKVKRSEILRLQNVYQIYRSRFGANYAVNDVTLGIFRGECFGLVGANGAGKTTLFRLLSGQISPTLGTIAIEESVGQRSDGVFGYCPQTDALDDLLTAREHLQLYALLKGVPSNYISKVVKNSLISFDLDGHADFSVRSLSGGTKRKLCTAIAMIGKPTIILLDEPTSGMDPGSRRLVWQSIIQATTQNRKAAVILSSHSIEECDVLCSRIGIMVNGQIQCLGTPQQLKNKFGGGITISFRARYGDTNSDDFTPILNFIKSHFPPAQIKAHHCKMVEFVVPSHEMPLSEIFRLLEKGSVQLGLQDISLNHMTLDQVFVGFVRQQSDGTQQNQYLKLSHEFAEEDTYTLQMNSLNRASNIDRNSSTSILSVDLSCSSKCSTEYATRL